MRMASMAKYRSIELILCSALYASPKTSSMKRYSNGSFGSISSQAFRISEINPGRLPVLNLTNK